MIPSPAFKHNFHRNYHQNSEMPQITQICLPVRCLIFADISNSSQTNCAAIYTPQTRDGTALSSCKDPVGHPTDQHFDRWTRWTAGKLCSDRTIKKSLRGQCGQKCLGAVAMGSQIIVAASDIEQLASFRR